jgi:hypothetical protein
MDLYFTLSEDGGGTWRPNERITTVSSNPGAGSLDAGLIGEYIGWCARHDKALAVWTDTRNGNQDVFAAVIDSVVITAADEPNRAPLPQQLSLTVFPNPFNAQATFSFTLGREAEATIVFFNTLGEEVLTRNLGKLQAGQHEQYFDFADLPSGLYLARVQAGHDMAFAKALLIK